MTQSRCGHTRVADHTGQPPLGHNWQDNITACEILGYIYNPKVNKIQNPFISVEDNSAKSSKNKLLKLSAEMKTL